MRQGAVAPVRCLPTGLPNRRAAMSAAVGGMTLVRTAAQRATRWMFAEFAISQGVRFGSNVLFAWLLYKEAFGLMMLVNIVTQGLQMMSDIGLGPSVVQHKNGGDPRYLGVAFTLQWLRSMVLAALCMVIAWPVAAHYAQSDPLAWRLLELLPLASISLIFGGFMSPRALLAQRNLETDRVVLINLGSQVVVVVTITAFALIETDVSALVYGNIAGAVSRTVLSYLVLRGAWIAPLWDRSIARELARFGGWIFVSTFATFFAQQIDRLMFAGRFDMGVTGEFHAAGNLVLLLPTLLGSLQMAVAFPAYSRIRVAGGAVRPVLQQLKVPILGALAAPMLALVCGGPEIVGFLYDDRWIGAGWMVSVMAIGVWFSAIESTYGAALLAIGAPRWIAFASAARPVAFLSIWGSMGDALRIEHVVVATVIADLTRSFVSLVGAARTGLWTPLVDLQMTVRVGVVGASCWFLCNRLRSDNTAPWWVVLAIAGVVPLACQWRSVAKCAQQVLRRDPIAKG